jgi:hypothetical protein
MASLAGLGTAWAGRDLPLAKRLAVSVAAGVAVAGGVRADNRREREARNVADAASLGAAVGGAAPLFGGWAIEADFAAIIARNVEHGAEVVVECGAGASTLVIAAMLQRTGRGRLVSLEHDRAYAERIRRVVDAAGLGGRVEVVVAPLRPCAVGGREVPWYDIAIATDALGGAVDLLVVDGPPQYTRWSRWPALPVLHGHLADDATVLVDDGRTSAALATTRAWTRAFPDMQRYWLDSLKGTWMLERRHAASRRRLADALLPVVSAVHPRPSGSGLWPVRR